ncbi:zinc ribbon domain-containing protein [Chloroflexota bacterium]
MKNPVRDLILLTVTILIFVAIPASGVFAQSANEPTGFKNVQLWIYPEYDDPRLLVMLEGQIVGVQAPAEVRFLIPAKASMYSAGSKDAQGQYTGGPPHREPSAIPGWDEISYELTTETFRVEYYDPIIIGQPDKTISYEFRWLYPISDINVTVQEPRSSSNFVVIPQAQAFVDGAGFTSYSYDYSDLDAEPPLQFEITYTKSDISPSLSIEEKSASSPLPTIIILAIVAVFIVGGFFWMRKPRPKTRAARRQLSRTTGRKSPDANQVEARFCTQCGQPIEGSHRFCPNCGAKR